MYHSYRSSSPVEEDSIGPQYHFRQYANQMQSLFNIPVRQRAPPYSASSRQVSMRNNQAQPKVNTYENIRIKMNFLKLRESPEYRAKLEVRQKLPVMQQRTDILNSVREHQVVLIVGPNRCGKSCQVPQILLDDYILRGYGYECGIVCTKFTKIEVLTLAERVADERNEAVGTSVGFQIRGESCSPRPNASILYCTNGILLKELRQDPFLKKYCICILDNTQPANSYTDKIMELLQNILPHRPDLKIILLSNNVLEDTFCTYFTNYHVIFIQARSSEIDLTEGNDDVVENLNSSDDVTFVDLSHAADNNLGEQGQQQNEKILFNIARAFIKKCRQLDPALLTEQQKQKILQCQNTIQCYKRKHPRKEKVTNTQSAGCNKNSETIEIRNNDFEPSTSTVGGVPIKRTISMDEDFMRPPTAIVGDDNVELDIAILDLSDQNGRISQDTWEVVEAKLISDMTNANYSKDQISFDKINWHRGMKVITCNNKSSLDFLKTAIAEIGNVMPDVNLKVVPRSAIVSYACATVWIPPPTPTMDIILQLIKKQNDGLNTDTWKIMPWENRQKRYGQEFRLVIDGASTKYIREKQGKIKFGLGTIRIRFFNF